MTLLKKNGFENKYPLCQFKSVNYKLEIQIKNSPDNSITATQEFWGL